MLKQTYECSEYDESSGRSEHTQPKTGSDDGSQYLSESNAREYARKYEAGEMKWMNSTKENTSGCSRDYS